MIIDSRYKVLEQLGTGAWANVYRVVDIRTGQIYSLKLFQNIDAHTLYEKFTAEEMHQITKFKHPNLLQVVSFGNMDKHIYYLAEYYPGKTLRNIKYKSSRLELLYDIIVQIVYALDTLHSQDIIHKDIKPENVLYRVIENKVEVKVLDYGFTKVDREKNQQKVSGTLPFIAPEIYLGKGACKQSDFYSLGVTLYYLITGTFPFSIEQISALMTGDQQNFFPKFPRETNSDVPITFEMFILKLLQKNPEDRFPDCQSIVEYINRIQPKKYPYSHRQSIINLFQFGYYLVRQDYAHKLVDYVPNIVQSNGKVIALIGGDGVGKDDLLTLFKYHLMTNEYYVFDYTCSAKNQDPFFALIKEFSFSSLNNIRKETFLKNISEKFKKYLEESEEESGKLSINADSAITDFEMSRGFINQLSEDKPLIFVIRAGQYLTEETINFVNFISEDINHRPIFIVISVNDPSKLQGLIHSVQLHVTPLSLEEATKFLNNLLKMAIPDDFAYFIWRRSCGNPRFIMEILVDLIRKKMLWRNDELNFNINFDLYSLPEDLVHSIYNRMSHLLPNTYKNLQKLSSVYTPLKKELISRLLNLSQKSLFSLLNDAVNNEILIKFEDRYEFSFMEAKHRFFSEISDSVKHEVSKKVIDFYLGADIQDIPTAEGLIKNCQICEDYDTLRTFKLMLYNLYSMKFEQYKAWQIIIEVIELDFSGKIEIPEYELRKDILLLVDKADLTGLVQKSLEILLKLENLPDFFETHFAFGSFYMRMEQFSKAEECYKKAYSLAITGRQQARTLIDLLWISSIKGHKEEMEHYISQLESYQLSTELEIAFNDRKGLYLSRFVSNEDAISFLEEVVHNAPQTADVQTTIRLGSLYNNLAIQYSQNKLYDEALKLFQQTKILWERIHLQRALGTIYNNIGDLSLKQGDTKTALEYFTLAREASEKIDNKRGLILAMLNFGEVYIKLGYFLEAEKYLKEAKIQSEALENKLFYDGIINNLAVAKGKLNNFDYYLSFIRDNVPSVFNFDVKTITPLVKSYIYYLFEVGQIEKIHNLLLNNPEYSKTHDEEFYYQVLGLASILKSDYNSAVQNFKTALDYALQIKSNYSATILNLRLAQGFLFLNKMEEANDCLKKAEYLVEKYNLKYWQTVINLFKIQFGLMNGNIPLRSLLRDSLRALKIAQENRYFILELDCLALISQIYYGLSAIKHASMYFTQYHMKVKEVSRNIPPEDQKSFITLRKAFVNSIKDFNYFSIVPRFTSKTDVWQEQLYALLKLDDMERVRYFLDKMIQTVFSPNRMCILISKQICNVDSFLEKANNRVFLSFNMDGETINISRDIIREALNEKKIIQKSIDKLHILVAPLWLRSNHFGCLILSDEGDLAFMSSELRILKSFCLHLSTLLIRIREFEEIHKKMSKMQELVDITRSFLRIHDLAKLEIEIVKYSLFICNASRGFLIKKDIAGNYLCQIALDSDMQIITSYPNLSKTALSEVQTTRHSLYTFNALDDPLFKNAFSVHDYHIHSLYCAPIIIDNEIYGLLYLDNFEANDKSLFVEHDVMNMFLMQISLALRNALGYNALMKKNWELHTLDSMKDEFIKIVSHELNTPLITLQGYVNKLKKNVDPLDFENTDLLSKVEKSTRKLISTIQDIITLNRYNATTELKTEPIDLYEILTNIFQEAEIIGKPRRMKFKLELEENLPKAEIEWQAFHLMIYNLVLNSIRFTSDFGMIVIGARRATFQQEKVDGKDSVIVYVQDNGIGIPEHEQQNIFKKFYELGDVMSHRSGTIEYRSGGLGIGLATSKRISELLNGKIWIRSKENEGTTVFVSLPVNTTRIL